MRLIALGLLLASDTWTVPANAQPPLAAATRACLIDPAPCSEGPVVRQVPLGCHYNTCADGTCPLDQASCPDGSLVHRQLPDCDFPLCPTSGECPREVGTCPDGITKVTRSQGTDCQWEPCPAASLSQRQLQEPDEEACPLDVQDCPDGSTVGREPPNCDFADCPPLVCPLDVFNCGNGITVGREPPDCEFPQCPEICPGDVFTCWDGSTVDRVYLDDCEFAPCPPSPAPSPGKYSIC